MKRSFWLIPILILVLTISFVSATNSCPPNIPVGYYGNISYNGNLLQGEYTLRTILNHEIVGTDNFNEGNYYVDVSPCYGISSGEVSFVINGIEANEKVNYDSNDWGKSFNLNLTMSQLPPLQDVCGNGAIDTGEECDDGNLNSSDGCSNICEVEYGYSCVSQPSVCTKIVNPFCGDAVCNNGESCSTCSNDCGSCATSSGGGGGGGGGGGSSHSTTTTASSTTSTASANSQNNSIPLPIQKLNESSDEKNINSGITGGVIGFVTSPIGISIFAVALLIIVLAIIIILKRRK